MYTRINYSQIFVLDLDKAIDFYVKTLGMELTNDMDLGFMRWVTVGVCLQSRAVSVRATSS